MGGHANIGPTAHYTAYAWHRLGCPHGELFATPTGAALYWLFRGSAEWMNVLSPRVPSMLQYLEYRHLLIESELDRLGPDRIVEVGAGLSRRGITWAADRKTPFVEIDLPAMASAKRRFLDRASRTVREAAGDRLRVVEADALDPGFSDLLVAELDGAARPAVIAEGLISYFSMEDRAVFLTSVARALGAGAGGTFLCDLHTVRAQARVRGATRILKLAIRTVTRGQGARPPFADLDHVRSFFSAAGFRDARQVDASEHTARTPRLEEVFSPALIIRGQV